MFLPYVACDCSVFVFARLANAHSATSSVLEPVEVGLFPKGATFAAEPALIVNRTFLKQRPHLYIKETFIHAIFIVLPQAPTKLQIVA